MKKELIIHIFILVIITITVIYISNTILTDLSNVSEEELKSITPMVGIKALGIFIGGVMVLAFIYSFWWFPKKCIKEYNQTMKENEEYYMRMKNL